MIKTIEEKDFNQVLYLINSKNNDKEFYCAYTSKNIESLRKDIESFLINGNALVIDNFGVVEGFISGFQYDPQTKNYDISGPYVVGNSIEKALSLIQTLKLKFGNSKLNFFFDKSSRFYNDLMEKTNAKFQGDEYELLLEKDRFRYIDNNIIDVDIMKDEDKAPVKRIHDLTFPDAYISANQVVNSERVYVLKTNNEVIGYSLIKSMKDNYYLELLGIEKDYRNKGFGRRFLSEILKNTFNENKHNKVVLVVETRNDNAVHLYTDLGFDIEQVNSSFKL